MKMAKPVFVFLNYENFYQNHRAMINSFSRRQLEDEGEKPEKLKKICKGALTNKEMNKTLAFDGKTALDPEAIASPCGFMAKSFPLDSYKAVKTPKGETLPVKTDKLIMAEEKEKFVVDTDVKQWVKVDDHRFINWMKSSSTSDFYKLWGRLDASLEPGKHTIVLDNSSPF